MTKLTDLTTEMTDAPAIDDLIHIVDVSDTSQDPAGSSKKIQIQNFAKNGIFNLTSAEVTQLMNIDSTTISTSQWAYLGAMNQGVATSNSPSFQNIYLTAAGSAQISVSNNLLIEADAEIQSQCTDNIILNTPNATIIVNSTATGIGINTDSLNISIGTSSAGNINLNSAAQINLTPDPLSAINLNGLVNANEIQVDNINLDGNTISDTSLAGLTISSTSSIAISTNIDITPSGDLQIGSVTGYFYEGATGFSGFGTGTPDTKVHVKHNGDVPILSERVSSATGTSLRALELVRTTTGTATAGIGAELAFRAQDGGGSLETIATIGAVLNAVPPAAEQGTVTWEIVSDSSLYTYMQAVASTGNNVTLTLNGSFDISTGTFALPSGTTVNEIVTSISGASTDDQLPTAKAVYDLFATGDTWDEIMHNGAIFTIANTENLSATINQNDTTNNPAALVITNTGSGNDITLPGLGIASGVLSGTTIVLNATGAGASVSNSTGVVISTTSLPVTINTNTTSDITVSSAADLLMSGASGVSISSSSGSIDITSNTLFDFATSGSITFPVYAKVVFRGDTTDPNDSATCAWYTTDDNTYPCMTMSAYKDGEQYIAFGAYFDAAFNWVSTHATSNYAIERTSTELQFYGDASIAKGSTINFDTMMAFNASTQEVKSTYIYNTTVTSTRDVEVESDGTLGYVSSLREHKMNINPVIDYDWLLKAPVCSFNYKKKHPETKKFTEDPDDELYFGFIAEEIEKLNKDFVFYDGDGKLRGINYKKMIPVLVKIVQDHERQLNKIH